MNNTDRLVIAKREAEVVIDDDEENTHVLQIIPEHLALGFRSLALAGRKFGKS